jgi:hypothetical protein
MNRSQQNYLLAVAVTARLAFLVSAFTTPAMAASPNLANEQMARDWKPGTIDEAQIKGSGTEAGFRK